MKLERHIAEEAKDWVRFESQVKDDYAHSVTDELYQCESEKDERDLILSIFLEKYMFFYAKSGKPHKATRLMLEALDRKDYQFPKVETRLNELERSIDHIINGSGLFPVLYKIQGIWDEKAVDEFMDYLKDTYKTEFLPNPDHYGWLKKHMDRYRKQGKPWKEK